MTKAQLELAKSVVAGKSDRMPAEVARQILEDAKKLDVTALPERKYHFKKNRWK